MRDFTAKSSRKIQNTQTSPNLPTKKIELLKQSYHSPNKKNHITHITPHPQHPRITPSPPATDHPPDDGLPVAVGRVRGGFADDHLLPWRSGCRAGEPGPNVLAAAAWEKKRWEKKE